MAQEKLKGAIPKEILIDYILQDLNGRKPDLSTARLIASVAFHGHNDRSDTPYVLHLDQVLLSGSRSQKKIIVGTFHDLFEDTVWTRQDLAKVGFEDDILDAIEDLSHKPGESYFDSIVRIGLSYDRGEGKNLLSIDTKIEDLGHNLSGRRQTALMTEYQQQKVQAYIVSYNYLVGIKKGDIEPGTSIAAFMDMRPELKDLALLQQFGTARSVGPTAPPVPDAALKRT